MLFKKETPIRTVEEAKQKIDEIADILLEAKKYNRVRITKKFMNQVTKDGILTNQEAYDMLKQSFEERRQ
jgi:hypothetical protein